ncbi:MAG: diacylglycerol/lipid kinase family protein, partial [Terriglobales bacterium]
HGGYLLAALAAIAAAQPLRMSLTAHPAPSAHAAADSAASDFSWMVAFANAPAYGGGMRIAPRAVLDDGILDVCRIRRAPRLRLLRCLYRLYSGRHLALPEVDYFQVTSLRLETAAPQDVYADGEFVGRTPVEVGVAPRALRVITP